MKSQPEGAIVRNPVLWVAWVVFLCVTGIGQVNQLSPLTQRGWFDHDLTQAKAPTIGRSLSLQARSGRIANASPEVVWVECPNEAQELGGMCGKLPVPLDRKDPNGLKIRIYFEVYLHTDPGPAVSAILANPGGPGASTTGLRALAFAFFSKNLDVHDFLLIDDRGRGGSDAIDCEELQHGTARFAQAESDCAAQLGVSASRYGTGDVAMDTEAVRAALGYELVDYWGGSYGGMDITAYATRFGQHLRSIVLDAPEGTPDLRAFELDGSSARAAVREVRLDCLRSPTCSMDHPRPDDEFAELVHKIRRKPLLGHAHDASGNPAWVRLDEGALLYLATYPTGRLVGTGEILAAADALSHGDSVPLLRLAAEVFPLVTDYGDPTSGSQGDHFAAMCVDARAPWDWSTPLNERKRQFLEAVSGLPDDHFAPFSKTAAVNLEVSFEKQCLWWEKPTPWLAVTPPHPTYPNIPTLVLSGDLDTTVPTEEVRKVASLFPESKFVRVAEAGHETILWTQCSASLQSEFFETLQVGDTSCTTTPETVWPALGRFPFVAADAHPAQVNPNGNNQIGESGRKTVTVAVGTAIDALKRSAIGSGAGVGLRGGSFESRFDSKGNQIITLHGCSFVSDVIVSGTITWRADLSLTADLTVADAGSARGSLHVDGNWQAPGPVGKFVISGSLGGKRVAVLVPEA